MSPAFGLKKTSVHNKKEWLGVGVSKNTTLLSLLQIVPGLDPDPYKTLRICYSAPIFIITISQHLLLHHIPEG